MTTPNEQAPVCETLADIRTNSGRRARVRGIYQQVDLRMRPKGPPQYSGRAAVRLGDGTEVLLEPSWAPAGVRSPDEIARYEGQAVFVSGTVHATAPAPAEAVAQIIGPCVSPVEDVAPAPGG
jgi:hypothetical protein